MQIRLARTALGLGVRELGEAAGISPSTVQRFESGAGGLQTRTLERLQTALASRGIVFIPADAGGGPGVRLSDPLADRGPSDARYATASTDRQNGHGVCEAAMSASPMTPLQMKLARTALGMGVRDLAAAAEVAPSTVQRFESGKGDMHVRTLHRVKQTLESGGAVFVSADADGGPGVRSTVVPSP